MENPVNIILKCERPKASPLNWEQGKDAHFCSFYSTNSTRCFSQNNQARRNKRHPNQKVRSKFSFFTGDHTCRKSYRLHKKNPVRINEVSKLTGYKATQKSDVFLSTNNEWSEKEIMKIIPFIIESKRLKCLEINQGGKSVLTENYKTC